MPITVSRRLVVDASIARAAGGGEATHPTSKHCRDVLQAILTICHRLVMTPDISGEWKAHQSRFARQWLVSMTARKKVVYRADAATHRALHDKIVSSSSDTTAQEIMGKDILLVTAALLTDKIVISLDEAARAQFAAASGRVGELKSIMWVNPRAAGEQSLTWLKSGAGPKRALQLGFSASTGSARGRRTQC
jgi:hypothetical protein